MSSAVSILLTLPPGFRFVSSCLASSPSTFLISPASTLLPPELFRVLAVLVPKLLTPMLLPELFGGAAVSIPELLRGAAWAGVSPSCCVLESLPSCSFPSFSFRSSSCASSNSFFFNASAFIFFCFLFAARSALSSSFFFFCSAWALRVIVPVCLFFWAMPTMVLTMVFLFLFLLLALMAAVVFVSVMVWKMNPDKKNFLRSRSSPNTL